MKGRNGSTSFLPLNKKGGLITNVFFKKCLTEEQTKYVYDKVESGDELKVRKVSPDIQNKLLLPKQLKERKDINLYEKVLGIKGITFLYSTTRPDGFSSTLQPYPWQGTHPTLV